MYKAIMYSVPGTGTRFAYKVLESCFCYTKTVGIENFLASNRERVYWHTHSWGDVSPLAGYHGARMVIPLRQPYRAFMTRRHTYPTMEGAMRQTSGFWTMLMEADKHFDTVYLPVDHENLDRVLLLRHIAEHLECDIMTDATDRMAREWKKVGTMGPSPEKGEWEKSRTIKGEPPTFLNDAVDFYYDKIGVLENL